MKYILLKLLLLVFLTIDKDEPVSLNWMQLDDMTMEYKFNEEFGFDIPYPVFGEEIKEFEGKMVTLEGFCLLIESEDEEIIILSKYPYSQCFFCGGAGPESVVDVLLTDEYKDHDLKMDQKVIFKGTLKLNVDDLDHLNYIFEGAEIVE